MPKKIDINHLTQKVQNLCQVDETWEGTIRRGPVWIFPQNGKPYRPFLILVTSPTGKILCTNIFDEHPTEEDTLRTILLAMNRPQLGAGKPRRPSTLFFDNPDPVATLEAPLTDLGIRCAMRHSLPRLEEALCSLEKYANRREPIPGLSKIQSVTHPLIGHLYELAAEFFRVKPWYMLNDNSPLEIRVQPDKNPRYAVVMGSGGEVFGLAVYDSLDDLKMMYQVSRLSSRQVAKRTSWLVLFFEEATAMSFDDLDAMDQNGWSVADESAYPIFGRTDKSKIMAPFRSDLLWMEGALAGILAYVGKHKSNSFWFATPKDEILPVKLMGGKTQIDLRFLDINRIREID